MSQISLSVPQVGLPNSSEDVKVANDMTTIQNVINGNLDASNLSSGLAQALSVNQSGQKVKGATRIPGSETRTNVAYGTMPTPDQVTGIVVATNGVVEVRYVATWLETVAEAARAAIFIGSTQLSVPVMGDGAPGAGAVAAVIGVSSGAPAGLPVPLSSFPGGLISMQQVSGGSGYPGDVITGQAIASYGGSDVELERPVGTDIVGGVTAGFVGGACEIFGLAAGTYTFSVQFLASSGSVTVSNRRLWVRADSFA